MEEYGCTRGTAHEWIQAAIDFNQVEHEAMIKQEKMNRKEGEPETGIRAAEKEFEKAFEEINNKIALKGSE